MDAGMYKRHVFPMNIKEHLVICTLISFISIPFVAVTRCMGVILLHPTSNKTAMTKNFARQFSKVAPSGENMALFRRFGHKVSVPKG